MISLNTAQIAEITGGRLSATADPTTRVLGVDTDSRQMQPGWLFVAKPGEVSDGHHFIDQAFDAGAVLALTERVTLDSAGNEHPAVIVEDAVDAMGQIAAHQVAYLKDRGARVVGITGSAGKTTTKDLLAAVLSADAETLSPVGSYNGEVGVPLTVFRAEETTRNLVIEMGATGIGHITYLTDMVRPDVGVVLCVGTAHAGEFGGVDNIEQAKGELVEALAPEGTAVVNLDDARVARMRQRTQARIIGFGIDVAPQEHDVVGATNVVIGADGRPAIDVTFPDGSIHHLRSGLMGLHHVYNVLAAAAGSYALGIAPETIVAQLTDRGPASRWRMERTERADGVSVINDAYNANPESMRAALQTLAELGLPGEDGTPRRTWAVLGPMLELGEDSLLEHDLLGRQAVRLNIKKLVIVGSEAKPAYNSAVLEGSWGDEAYYVETLDDAESLLQQELAAGDIVLFKSSNSAGLRHLGDRIAQANPNAATVEERTE